MSGHIGIYIGDGLAVECTPSWKNCVQVTACNCTKSGYDRRNWTKHGRLPYVSYTGAAENVASGGAGSATGSTTTTGTTSTTGEIVYTVVAGDTLIKIAAKCGTTYQALAAYNGIANPNLIRVGQQIKIPGTGTGIQKGSKVRVNSGAKTYTGGGLASFVYNNVYDVIQISGDRVVIGIGTAVTAAMNVKDLTLV